MLVQRIVIIGAGLTGLSAAYHLEQLGQFDVNLYEREDTVGGLTRSVSESGFTFDYTGHFLHSNNPYFSQFLAHIFKPGELQSIKRNAQIYTKKRFMPYPFQTHVNHLPLQDMCECIEYFVQRNTTKEPKTYKQMLLGAFGKGMCKHFFFSYARKNYAYPLNKLMPDQAGRFIPKISLSDILANMQHEGHAVGYNTHFLYPKEGGIQSFSQNITQRLSTKPHLYHTVAEINPAKKIVTFTNGAAARYDTLISTMPLDILLQKIKFSTASNLVHQHTNLQCNTVINVNLGIKRPALEATPFHWMYFPEKAYSFYRLGCWSAISRSLAPENTTSLYAEASALYPTEKEIGRMIRKINRDILKLFSISPDEICFEKTLTLNHAYVIYNDWRKQNLPTLLSTLKNDFQIHSVGRFGSWKYSSMQEAILDGKQTAEEITQNAPNFQHLGQQLLMRMGQQ